MIENALVNLSERLRTQEYRTSGTAVRFVGDDTMVPQVNTAVGWKQQIIDGVSYFPQGDIWVSGQVFYHKLQFRTNKFENEKKFYLSLYDHTYIDYVVVYLENVKDFVTFSLEADNFQRMFEFNSNTLLDLNLQYIAKPIEQFHMRLFNNISESLFDFSMEICYRIVL